MTPALERLLVETVAELFLAYDSPVHRVTGHFTQSASSLAAPNLLVSALDVSGPPSEASIAKGRVLLLTSFDFLASCRPEGFTEVLSPKSARDWIYVRDWAKEITNQLVGRVLNHIGEAGLSLRASLPMLVNADAVRGQIAARHCPVLRFASGYHEVQLWFDVTVPPRIEQALAEGAGSRVITPGTMILLQERTRARVSERTVASFRPSERR